MTPEVRRNTYYAIHTAGVVFLSSVFFFIFVMTWWGAMGPRYDDIAASLYFFIYLKLWMLLLFIPTFVVVRRPLFAALIVSAFTYGIRLLGDLNANQVEWQLLYDFAENLVLLGAAAFLACFIMRRLFGPGALK